MLDHGHENHFSRILLRGCVLPLLMMLAGVSGGVKAAEQDRIMSLGGSITEILYALRLQDRVAGLDATSLYPALALQEKPSVGYVRALSAEGILSLKPSLVLAIEGAGPPDALNLVRQTGVPLHMIPDDPTPEESNARSKSWAVSLTPRKPPQSSVKAWSANSQSSMWHVRES